jgi:abortive infection bacteriophage resistance protein
VNRDEKDPFSKPWLPYRDQLRLLVSRGLGIDDSARAATILSHLKYYRFSGYCLAFEARRHQFRSGVSFEQVYGAYEFDRELRRLLTEALEWVEIDVRTVVAHEFARRHGPFGHLDAAVFYRLFDHHAWLERAREAARRSNEVFVAHHRDRYREFPDLPIWVLVEILSFASVSRLFAGMLREDQKAVAGRYARQPGDLASWLHHLSYVRNSCAHYARIWDRIHPIAPRRPAGASWTTTTVPRNDRIYMTLLVLASMVSRIDALSVARRAWARRVEEHVETRTPCLDHAMSQMGLPPDWMAHPEWRRMKDVGGEAT